MKGLDPKVSSRTDRVKMSGCALVDSYDIDLSNDESIAKDDTTDTA
jgi:hypothetical protein